MIVQGQKVQTIDVEIDPVSFLHDLEEAWRTMCRLPIDADLKAGYWVREERAGHDAETVRIRLATQKEMLQYNAFETVLEIARDM